MQNCISTAQSAAPCSPRRAGGRGQGGHSLSQKRMAPLNPKRKVLIGSLRLEWPLCLRNENTCARRCRVWCCYTTWPTSTTRCRSAHLVFVQPNHLLSAIHIVLVMRTAASTAMPPWQATTELIKFKVDGNCVRPPTRRHSDSEDRRKSNRLDTSSSRHLIAQCVQFFKPQSDNTKSFSWGSKGDILFCEREYPL